MRLEKVINKIYQKYLSAKKLRILPKDDILLDVEKASDNRDSSRHYQQDLKNAWKDVKLTPIGNVKRNTQI